MWSCIVIILLFWMIPETEEIKNARLILPRIVRAGTTVTLLCLYDLEKAPLYSVQWYRGQHEFFRYVPSENPPSKAFKVPGIYVDVLSSNDHEVTLRNIPVHISGEISCEITADAPYFSTACTSSNLTIIELDLDFKISQQRINDNEFISANCSASPPSLRTKLSFHLDDRKIPEEFITRRSLNFASLEMNTSSMDFIPSIEVNPIELKCSAFLDGRFFVASKAITIEVRELDNNFDRLSNSSNLKKLNPLCQIIFILLVLHITVIKDVKIVVIQKFF